SVQVESSHINPPPRLNWYSLFSLVSRSMNSGAPASTAPPARSSGGMIALQSDCRVLYWCGVKNLGAYTPAADAFSACTILCAYSAACAGMTLNTDPATTPAVKVLRMSRRVIEFDISTDFPSLPHPPNNPTHARTAP